MRTKYFSFLSLFSTLCFCLSSFSLLAFEIKLKGMVEAGYIHANSDDPLVRSWMDNGVGILRFNENDDLKLTQAAIEFNADVFDDISFDATANYYPDGEKQVGFTEAYFTYSPLTQGLKQQLKIGMFYPKMSLENVGVAWTSPYTYTFSAINSWLAEELRTVGAEWSIHRNGRKYQSPYSYSFSASIFKVNDGLGSILAWRGWGLHNRQTMLNEKLVFANYFRFQEVPNHLPHRMPNYVEPIKETDGRLGYYAGINWRYLKQTDVRFYYYNNNANPLALESNLQYAWQNEFTSLALMHKFNRELRVLAQWLNGNTHMGSYQTGVNVDINSWYVMLSYLLDKKHRLSVRFDDFKAVERDANAMDPNDSNGHSVTLAWRHQLTSQWNIGSEYIRTNSDNENRALWQGLATKQVQNQFMLLTQFVF